MSDKQNSLRQELRALPPAAWVLFLGVFLNKFGTFVLPFLTIYMTRLGYSTRQAGLTVGAYGVGSLCAAFWGGYLADRFGRRKTIALSMFSGAMAMLCLSQARSIPTIMLLAAATGLTAELYRPASTALLADLVPPSQRVTAFAAHRLAMNAGFAFGPATAGFLAKNSFHWLFIGDAVSSIIFGLLAWFALPKGVTGIRMENSLWDTVRVLRNDRRFRQVLLGSLVIAVVFVQILSSMSLEITRSGFSPSVYGLVISLNGILIVLCELPLTVVTKRFAVRRVIACGFLLIGLGFASNALVRTLPLLALTTILFTVGEMIALPISAAYIADLAPAHQRGLYMGTYGLTWSLAFVCGPSLGLLLFSINPLALWLLCGVFGIISATIIIKEPERAKLRQSSAQLTGKQAEALVE